MIEPGHTVEQTIGYIGQYGQMVMKICCLIHWSCILGFRGLGIGVGCLGGFLDVESTTSVRNDKTGENEKWLADLVRRIIK